MNWFIKAKKCTKGKKKSKNEEIKINTTMHCYLKTFGWFLNNI